MCRTEVAKAGSEDPNGIERNAPMSAPAFHVREYETRDDDAIYALEHKSQMENPISRFVDLPLLRMPVLRLEGFEKSGHVAAAWCLPVAWPTRQAKILWNGRRPRMTPLPSEELVIVHSPPWLAPDCSKLTTSYALWRRGIWATMPRRGTLKHASFWSQKIRAAASLVSSTW